MESTLKLLPHQESALPIMKGMETGGSFGGFLADEPGSGKTIVFLYYNEVYKLKEPTLIVCPVGVLATWSIELEKVMTSLGRTCKVLTYHGKSRNKKNLDKEWDYVITTYGMTSTGDFEGMEWGRVVLDESHEIRNGCKKNPPKYASCIYSMSTKSRFRWCISGTPFLNRLKEIGSQAKFVGTEPYNDPDWWDCSTDEERDYWRENFVIRRTNTIQSHSKPLSHIDIEIKPTDVESKIIDKLREKGAKEYRKLNKADGKDKKKIYNKILGVIGRLRVVSDSYYSKSEEEFTSDDVIKNCSKVNRIVEDLREQIPNDEKKGVVVFSHFTSFLSLMKTVISDKLGVEVMSYNGGMTASARDDIVKRFNESRNPRVLLISLKAGGVGLSLQYGSSTVFICEPYYNPFLELQAEKRVDRHGQNSLIKIFRYCMKDSVETWINSIKDKKTGIASSIGLTESCGISDPESLKVDIAVLFKVFVGFKEDIKKPINIRKSSDSKKVVIPVTKLVKIEYHIRIKWWVKGEIQKSETKTINGEKNGVSRKWHRNQETMELCTWKNGKKNGPYKLWYQDGTKREDTFYVNDKLFGLYRMWNSNNILIEQSKWKNGQCQENGKLDDGKSHRSLIEIKK
jgi:transcription termination factor 2